MDRTILCIAPDGQQTLITRPETEEERLARENAPKPEEHLPLLRRVTQLEELQTAIWEGLV